MSFLGSPEVVKNAKNKTNSVEKTVS